MALIQSTERTINAIRKADALQVERASMLSEESVSKAGSFMQALNVEKAEVSFDLFPDWPGYGDFVCTIVHDEFDVWSLQCNASYDERLAGIAYYRDTVLEVPKFFKAFDFIPHLSPIDLVFTAEMDDKGEVKLQEDGISLGVAYSSDDFAPGKYCEKICTLTLVSDPEKIQEGTPEFIITERRMGGPIIIKGLW